MNSIKIIKNEQERARAVERLIYLMDIDHPTEDVSAQIELLALVIQDYEQKVSPLAPVDPIDAILFRIEQMGMKRQELIPYIGSQSKVSEVLARTRPLTLAMMRRLHKGLGIPAEVLLGSDNPEIDLSNNPTLDYSQFPLVEMNARGYFGERLIASARELKDRAEELVSGFLRGGAGDKNTLAFLRAPQSQSGTRNMNDYALAAWMERVKQKAIHEKIDVPYQPGVVTDLLLREVVKLSSFDTGPKLAKEHLARYGIVLVVEEHFQKTYLDGVAMLLNDRAIIGMTLRHDRLDNFWFVLLHELAHIQKHLNPDNPLITDDLDDKVQQSQAIEQEADQIAQESLITSFAWLQSKVRTSYLQQDAHQLARELGISISIVAGRVRRETGNWRLLHNCLGKGVVKLMFERME
ncbi:ImmA/IrrE family metallo-endopeptidase (plasmid) [Deefgea piscis]|uniref:ImmA/IrrE family metallo-endopeptidase n=1 Tax=Deefgea piscis TaxID=2739061 RepID=A0A6M8T2N7_9NEIS|nr:ImmA/IrrE family metallo-endopeptidase [Deefgea piscis]QKJ68247.1 ImmA/IrrE family metallo-endopeptidase [Deefgea piscis]